MGEDEQRFTVNAPDVIEDIIDGEAIIADLGRGLYYSLDETGSQVWAALIAGTPVDTIIDAAAAATTSSADEISAHIGQLLTELEAELLIVATDAPAQAPTPDLAALFAPTGAPFSAPKLSKYSDMEQLLMLDPIHDVDVSGWPNSPGPAPTAGS